MSKPVVSILINFHGEGHIAQSTIKSALEAKAEFIKEKLGCVEIVAVLDDPSETTRRVVKANADQISKIHVVKYRDLAKSRNFGVEACAGEFIAFLDGDDLWSRNWLVSAFHFMRELSGPSILHTAYFISFGSENFARVQWDSDEFLFDPLTLMHNWHFCNNIFSQKTLLSNNPFVSYDHDSGFGSEDWHWSCETIAKGLRHVPVPGTAYFYRMKQDVMAIGGSAHLGLGAKPGLLVRPSELFSPDSEHFDRRAVLVSDFLNVKKLDGQFKEAPKSLPQDIQLLWKRAAAIEPDCYPTQSRLNRIKIFYPQVHYNLTVLFRRIMRTLDRVESLVFLEHRDSKEIGLAAAKVISSQIARRKRVGVLLMSQIPINTDYSKEGLVLVPLWRDVMETELTGAEIVSLIVRLILQIRPKEIVNLWSTYYAELIERPYLKAFSSLGISTTSLISGEGDIFHRGFREDLAWFAYSGVDRSNLIFSNVRSANYFAERHKLVAPKVSYLDSSGDVIPVSAGFRSAKSEVGKTETPTISCILNVHREGFLLDSTISSIAEMIRYTLETAGVSSELIVVADSADQKTIDMLTTFSSLVVDAAIHIHFVAFRDLGTARNFGVERAKGKFVALLDADDLYCRDWLVKSLEEFNRCLEERVVIHPQYNVYFGRERRIFEHKPMNADSEDRYALAFANFWTSLIFTTRQLLEELRFDPVRLQDGLGFEDWSWNIKSLKNRVSHRVASGTAHFIRLKAEGSLNVASVDAGATYYPAGLFKEVGAE